MGTKNTKLNKYFLIALFAAIVLAASSCSDKKGSSTAELETTSSTASMTSIQTTTQTETSAETTTEMTTAESTTITTQQAPVTTVNTVATTQAPVVTTATTVVTTQAPVVTTQAPVVTTMATQPVVTTVAASQTATVQGVPGKDVIWLNKDTCVPISQYLTLRFGGRDQTEMKTIYDAVYYLFYPQPGYTVSMWDVFQESMINDFGKDIPNWQDIDINNDTDMFAALKFCGWMFDDHCGSNNGTSNASTILCAYSPNYNKQLSQGNCGTQVQCYRAVLNWWGFETRYIGGYDARGSGVRHAMIQIKRPNGKWYFTLSIDGTEDESNGGDNVIGYRVGGYIIDVIKP